MREGWVEIHRGPVRETAFLAELLEAIDVRARIVRARASRAAQRRHETTRLLVLRRERRAAEGWLERAFAEAWNDSRRVRAGELALGC